MRLAVRLLARESSTVDTVTRQRWTSSDGGLAQGSYRRIAHRRWTSGSTKHGRSSAQGRESRSGLSVHASVRLTADLDRRGPVYECQEHPGGPLRTADLAAYAIGTVAHLK